MPLFEPTLLHPDIIDESFGYSIMNKEMNTLLVKQTLKLNG